MSKISGAQWLKIAIPTIGNRSAREELFECERANDPDMDHWTIAPWHARTQRV
ncbi:MAG TPA: hypothetical protein VNX88_16710 [Terriglobales bacterium]|jgi:hypothetical protein|nr:hypothetical protein [Terriglobales bacterium]